MLDEIKELKNNSQLVSEEAEKKYFLRREVNCQVIEKMHLAFGTTRGFLKTNFVEVWIGYIFSFIVLRKSIKFLNVVIFRPK